MLRVKNYGDVHVSIFFIIAKYESKDQLILQFFHLYWYILSFTKYYSLRHFLSSLCESRLAILQLQML